MSACRRLYALINQTLNGRMVIKLLIACRVGAMSERQNKVIVDLDHTLKENPQFYLFQKCSHIPINLSVPLA